MKDNRFWRGKHIFAVWAILTLSLVFINLRHEFKVSEIQQWPLGTYFFYLIAFTFNIYATRYSFRHLLGPSARLYPLDILGLVTSGLLCCIALFEVLLGDNQQANRVLPLFLAMFAIFLAYLYSDSRRQKLDQGSDAEATTSENCDP